MCIHGGNCSDILVSRSQYTLSWTPPPPPHTHRAESCRGQCTRLFSSPAISLMSLDVCKMCCNRCICFTTCWATSTWFLESNTSVAYCSSPWAVIFALGQVFHGVMEVQKCSCHFLIEIPGYSSIEVRGGRMNWGSGFDFWVGCIGDSKSPSLFSRLTPETPCCNFWNLRVYSTTLKLMKLMFSLDIVGPIYYNYVLQIWHDRSKSPEYKSWQPDCSNMLSVNSLRSQHWLVVVDSDICHIYLPNKHSIRTLKCMTRLCLRIIVPIIVHQISTCKLMQHKSNNYQSNLNKYYKK